MQLLIVDDEEIIRKGLLRLDWESAGIRQVHVAEDGIQAKEFLMRRPVDIILSDIKMPGMSGLELAEFVSETSRLIKVILLTGFNEFSYAKSAIRSGVCDYLLKPIQPAELLEAVRTAVQSLQQEHFNRKIIDAHQQASGYSSVGQEILQSFGKVNDTAQLILEDIILHYKQPLTLHALAEKHHFSSMYIGRVVKKETGYSFVDILTAVRLMHACGYLLSARTYKIQEICELSGFHDQRYFSQVFKRVFACPPLEYRKRCRNGADIRVSDLLQRMEQEKQGRK